MHIRPAPREEYPTLAKAERRYIAVLKHRLAYLKRRLAEGDHSEGAGAFLAGEASALNWAINKIDEFVAAESQVAA